MLFGRNAVLEALRGKRRHKRLIVAEGIRWDARMQQIRADVEQRSIPLDIVPRQLLDDTVSGGRHQGLVLVTSPYPYAELDDVLDAAKSVLILDHLQDPQNVGSLLRSAEVLGVPAVILPKDRSAAITPAVVNASAGAVEHLNVVRETNVARAIEALKKRGYWIVGLDNTPDATSIDAIDPGQPFALVIGAEGSGLSGSAAAHCDYIARIEQVGQIDSLNASVAGSIALFLLTRERGNRG